MLVVGGGSLLLLGVVERPTADVDIVAFSSPSGYSKADILPAFLTTAVREVGDALGLGDAWFNGGPAGLIDFGLPAGLEDRVTVRVCERSKHFADLRALAPTPAQLLTAARSTRTHDPSSGFLVELQRILNLLGVEVPDADL